jgi:hypothetical protein
LFLILANHSGGETITDIVETINHKKVQFLMNNFEVIFAKNILCFSTVKSFSGQQTPINNSAGSSDERDVCAI